MAAVALLVLQTAASAHELEHALERHDEPACALHLYANCAGKPALATIDPPFATAAVYSAVSTARPPHTAPLLAYRGRAPPRPLPNAA